MKPGRAFLVCLVSVPMCLGGLILFLPYTAHAQTPTGNIVGIVTDPAGERVAEAHIHIVNRDSGLSRKLVTSTEGVYTAAALPPGLYVVSAAAQGFRSLERTATVEAGTTTTVNLPLEVGEVAAQVKVDDAAPLINYDSSQVGGMIGRKQIENLPLNGRNFLELAKLEPGVGGAVLSTDRVFVSILGAGLFNPPRIGNTRATIDGANISAIGTRGARLQVSQEDVQEFQLATVNFDLSTSLTTNGAINIVTRSGGNQYHGSGFYFYRDHHMAAYPGLQRDPTNPDPFFQRSQFGYNLGGPIRKHRVFFFTSYERNEQRGVLSIQPLAPEFASLGGIYASPYEGNQFNLRFDVRLNRNHNGFVRYTHDGNDLFGPRADSNNPLPSGWSRVRNWVDQSIAGLTSVLSSDIVNDLRFSYFFETSAERPASGEDCPGCFGLGAPLINIPDAGVRFGMSQTNSFVGRRYQLTESLSWQKGNHRLRFGFDWEHATTAGQLINQEPATIQLYSPQEVQLSNLKVKPELRIPLPSSFLTLNDVLQLPLRSFVTAVGPGSQLQPDFRKYGITDQYRLYAADTLRLTPRLTVNYGLAWSYEPHTLNSDLTRPTFLTAILGQDHLNPPAAEKNNFSPTLGLAWAVTRDSKTIVRMGAGLYYDPLILNANTITNDRIALSPAGTGRRTTPGSAINNQDQDGTLDFPRPSVFTAADLLALLPGIRTDLLQRANPDNRDFTFRNLDLNKTGSNLTDPFYQTPYALHFSTGMQRELAHDLVLSADFAWRRFVHTLRETIDYNHFNRRPQGPVIPVCTAGQRNEKTAVCSAGPITFDNTTGIAQYKGLLVRLEKRFSGRTQFLASYALGSYTGTNFTGNANFPGTGFNNDNWFENYGPLPTDIRHILNVSGVFDLRWHSQVSFSVSAYSAPPFSPYVANFDFNGDGTANDLLPGTTVNAFNRNLGKNDLAQLVQSYNQHFSGRQTPDGLTAPALTLPANYSFNDSFFTQDLRLSRSFSLGTERVRLIVFGEVFNLLNTANLVQYGANLKNSAAFGQPGARFNQAFGSGEPRAFQFGARLNF